MTMQIWAVNYIREDGHRCVKVFDDERSARSFCNHPPAGIKVVGKPWNLMD